MTAEIIYRCRYADCHRKAVGPGFARCEEHLLRLFPREERPEPKGWVARALAGTLPTRIDGGIPAA